MYNFITPSLMFVYCVQFMQFLGLKRHYLATQIYAS